MQDFKQSVQRAGWSLLFLAILVGFLSVLSGKIAEAVVRSEDLVPERNKSTVKLQKEAADTVDVMIVGDSLSYCTFSPMQMWNQNGISAFVGGQAEQTIQESYYMLKTAFRNQKPRVVVLETDVIFRRQEGVQGMAKSLSVMGQYYCPLVAYHDIWKAWILGKEYPMEDYKGFQLRSGVQPYENGAYMHETEEREEISGMVRFYLGKILDLCRENGAQVLLVSAPSPANYHYAKHNALAEYAKQAGLSYLDLNLQLDTLGMDWGKDTFDKGDHLNLSGARKVTAYMSWYLQDTYRLFDHRGEEAYAAWAEEAKTYEGRAKQVLQEMGN